MIASARSYGRDQVVTVEKCAIGALLDDAVGMFKLASCACNKFRMLNRTSSYPMWLDGSLKYSKTRGRLFAAAHAQHCLQHVLAEPRIGDTSLWKSAVTTISVLSAASLGHPASPRLRTNADGSVVLLFCPGYSHMMTLPRHMIYNRCTFESTTMLCYAFTVAWVPVNYEAEIYWHHRQNRCSVCTLFQHAGQKTPLPRPDRCTHHNRFKTSAGLHARLTDSPPAAAPPTRCMSGTLPTAEWRWCFEYVTPAEGLRWG